MIGRMIGFIGEKIGGMRRRFVGQSGGRAEKRREVAGVMVAIRARVLVRARVIAIEV